jgi:hypothetical protein
MLVSVQPTLSIYCVQNEYVHLILYSSEVCIDTIHIYTILEA